MLLAILLAAQVHVHQGLFPTRPPVTALPQDDGAVRDIGSRFEPFVDPWLISKLDNTWLQLHEPRLAPPMDQPADNMEYGTVIKDGNLFRLYTRDGRGAKFDGDASEVTRYCESDDGIHWRKPNLGLVELNGSKDNNIILHEKGVCHNFCPFIDTRPGVPANERYKALGGVILRNPGGGLIAFASADGIRWRRLADKPVITTNWFLGMEMSMFLRLCTRAPITSMRSSEGRGSSNSSTGVSSFFFVLAIKGSAKVRTKKASE